MLKNQRSTFASGERTSPTRSASAKCVEAWEKMKTAAQCLRGRLKKWKFADKPGSVETRTARRSCLGNHSSRSRVTTALQQPTREQREPRHCSPIWPCPGWGLPCRSCYQSRGELLPDDVFTPPETLLALGFAPFHPCLCRQSNERSDTAAYATAPSMHRTRVRQHHTATPVARSLGSHRRSALCCTFRRLTAPGR